MWHPLLEIACGVLFCYGRRSVTTRSPRLNTWTELMRFVKVVASAAVPSKRFSLRVCVYTTELGFWKVHLPQNSFLHNHSQRKCTPVAKSLGCGAEYLGSNLNASKMDKHFCQNCFKNSTTGEKLPDTFSALSAPPLGGVFEQRGHSANYYGDYSGNNPENHPPAASCTINSKLQNSNI